jgi:hypothetical protein
VPTFRHLNSGKPGSETGVSADIQTFELLTPVPLCPNIGTDPTFELLTPVPLCPNIGTDPGSPLTPVPRFPLEGPQIGQVSVGIW